MSKGRVEEALDDTLCRTCVAVRTSYLTDQVDLVSRNVSWALHEPADTHLPLETVSPPDFNGTIIDNESWCVGPSVSGRAIQGNVIRPFHPAFPKRNGRKNIPRYLVEFPLLGGRGGERIHHETSSTSRHHKPRGSSDFTAATDLGAFLTGRVV